MRLLLVPSLGQRNKMPEMFITFSGSKAKSNKELVTGLSGSMHNSTMISAVIPITTAVKIAKFLNRSFLYLSIIRSGNIVTTARLHLTKQLPVISLKVFYTDIFAASITITLTTSVPCSA